MSLNMYKYCGIYTRHLSGKDGRKIALITDKASHSLLRDENKWAYWKSFEIGLRVCFAFVLEGENQASKNIAYDGYHIYRMKRILRTAR